MPFGLDFQGKEGPLPVWGWILAGGAGIAVLYYFLHRNSSAAQAQTAPAIVPGLSLGGGGSSGGGTTPPNPQPTLYVCPDGTLVTDPSLCQGSGGGGGGGGTGSGTNYTQQQLTDYVTSLFQRAGVQNPSANAQSTVNLYLQNWNAGGIWKTRYATLQDLWNGLYAKYQALEAQGFYPSGGNSIQNSPAQAGVPSQPPTPPAATLGTGVAGWQPGQPVPAAVVPNGVTGVMQNLYEPPLVPPSQPPVLVPPSQPPVLVPPPYPTTQIGY